MDTINFDEKEKSKLVQSIKEFYASKNNYIKFGIPFTKKYLLEEPPGRNIAPLIYELALMFGKTLVVVDFGRNFGDVSPMDIIKNLDKDIIIVLENIDNSFGPKRQHNNDVSFSSLMGTLAHQFSRDDKPVDGFSICENINNFYSPKKEHDNDDSFRGLMQKLDYQFATDGIIIFAITNNSKNFMFKNRPGIIDYVFRFPEPV